MDDTYSKEISLLSIDIGTVEGQVGMPPENQCLEVCQFEFLTKKLSFILLPPLRNILYETLVLRNINMVGTGSVFNVFGEEITQKQVTNIKA